MPSLQHGASTWLHQSLCIVTGKKRKVKRSWTKPQHSPKCSIIGMVNGWMMMNCTLFSVNGMLVFGPNQCPCYSSWWAPRAMPRAPRLSGWQIAPFCETRTIVKQNLREELAICQRSVVHSSRVILTRDATLQTKNEALVEQNKQSACSRLTGTHRVHRIHRLPLPPALSRLLLHLASKAKALFLFRITMWSFAYHNVWAIARLKS